MSRSQEPRLVAYDYSGSTEECAFYHDTVQRVLRQYEPYDVVLWDNQLQVATAKQLKGINRTRDGRGGTRPILVAQHCVERQVRGHLILVTDGEILPRHVEELDRYLETNQMLIGHLDCYLIQTAENDKLDATVIAPFIRRFPHVVNLYGLNSREPVVVASGGGTHEELLGEIKNIKSVSEFQDKFEHLFSEIVTKMLGKCEDLAIRDEILNLQRRLLNEMKSLPPGFPIEELRRAFDSNSLDDMQRLTSQLHSQFLERWTEPTWPPQLFHLLRMCTGNLGSVYSLSALGSRFQANRVRRADVVENFELSSVQVLEGPAAAVITCPISYEEEHDVVLLVRKPDQGLLAGESSELTNAVITNPLAALRWPEFCQKILSHLDHPIALRSMKEAEEAGFPIKVSPLTRAPVLGGLFLGAGREHSHATDFTIAQLIVEGKRAGNPDLWFMLIWWLLEQNRVPHLAEILPQIREHLRFRMRNHLGTFTMTNTPFMPITLVPMGIAAWCTISARAIGASDEQATTYLKCHLGHIEILESVVELLGYPLPPAASQFLRAWHTVSRIRKCILGRDVEIINWGIANCHNIVRIDREKIHNDQFKFVPSVIPIDGEPNQEQVSESERHLPQWFIELSPKMRRAAVRMLQLFDISALPRNDLDMEIPAIAWQYGLREFEIPRVLICPATCRPFYFDLDDHREWRKHSERVFGDVEHQIHIHRYFIDYVNKFKSYPTKDEFIVFVYHDIVPRHKSTLPFEIIKFVDQVFTGYSQIMETISPQDFNSRTVRSMRLQWRRQIESEYKKQHPQAQVARERDHDDAQADAQGEHS